MKKFNTSIIVVKIFTLELSKIKRIEITICIVNIANYVEKTKKGVIEFVGFKWKQIEVKPIDNLEIENIIIEKIKKVKNKNV